MEITIFHRKTTIFSWEKTPFFMESTISIQLGTSWAILEEMSHRTRRRDDRRGPSSDLAKKGGYGDESCPSWVFVEIK